MSDPKFKDGLEAYNKKKYKTAFSIFKAVAKGERGHTTAQYYLGVMYFDGQGVPQNYIHSYMWLNITRSKDDVKEVEEIAGKEIEELIEALIKLMSSEDIAEAQELARIRVEF